MEVRGEESGEEPQTRRRAGEDFVQVRSALPDGWIEIGYADYRRSFITYLAAEGAIVPILKITPYELIDCVAATPALGYGCMRLLATAQGN